MLPIFFWGPEKNRRVAKSYSYCKNLGFKFGGDNFCARQPPKAGEAIQWSDKPMAEKEGWERESGSSCLGHQETTTILVAFKVKISMGKSKKDGSSFEKQSVL